MKLIMSWMGLSTSSHPVMVDPTLDLLKARGLLEMAGGLAWSLEHSAVVSTLACHWWKLVK